MSETATVLPEVIVKQLRSVCARRSIAEIHFQDDRSEVFAARTRFFRIENGELSVYMPKSVGKNLSLEPGQQLIIYFVANELHYGFKSEVLRLSSNLAIDSQRGLSGVTMSLPSRIVIQQRRQIFRISLERQNIVVHFHRTAGDVPHAAPLCADRFKGRIVNVSVGGMCLRFGAPAQTRFLLWERLYVSFRLPGIRDGFVLPFEVRHYRRVKDAVYSLMGVLFTDVDELHVKHQIRRLQQFIVTEQRRRIHTVR